MPGGSTAPAEVLRVELRDRQHAIIWAKKTEAVAYDRFHGICVLPIGATNGQQRLHVVGELEEGRHCVIPVHPSDVFTLHRALLARCQPPGGPRSRASQSS